MSKIGEKLRELRGNRSLREIEKISGVSHTYLSSLEKGADPRTGKERKPTVETLQKLAEVYNYSIVDLMVLAGYWNEEDLLEPIDFLQVITDRKNGEDLNTFLEKPGLKYKGHELTNQDRKLTKTYLDALFIERLKED